MGWGIHWGVFINYGLGGFMDECLLIMGWGFMDECLLIMG